MSMRQLWDQYGSFVRASVFVVGALIVLQSSQDVTPSKVVYVAAAGLALLGSVIQVRRHWNEPVVVAARPWLVASVVVAALVLFTLPHTIFGSTEIQPWLRDAASYTILVAAPWIAVDLGLSASYRAVLGLTLLAGAAVTFSYGIVWAQRRGITDLPIDRVVLPSAVLAMAMFATLVALSVSAERRRAAFAVAACLTVAILVLSGSRSPMVILLSCPIILLASWLTDRSTSVRPKVVATVAPILVVFIIMSVTLLRISIPDGLASLASLVNQGPGGPRTEETNGGQPEPFKPNLSQRYESIGSVLTGRDASLQERVAQTKTLLKAFAGSPILGIGLGVTVPFVDSTGELRTDDTFTADSPVLLLTKFGLLGLTIVGVLVWAFATTLRTLHRRRETRQAWLILVAFAAGWIALTPFGWQVEDKGTGLALALLLGLALIQIRQAAAVARPVPEPAHSPLAETGAAAPTPATGRG